MYDESAAAAALALIRIMPKICIFKWKKVTNNPKRADVKH